MVGVLRQSYVSTGWQKIWLGRKRYNPDMMSRYSTTVKLPVAQRVKNAMSIVKAPFAAITSRDPVQ